VPGNPDWARDELILALDLYFRVYPRHPSQTDTEVVGLSQLLNSLPIHADHGDGATFRNPNGVSMKLSNFLRFDPSYEGAGLSRGNHLEAEVWHEFADRRDALARTAEAIRKSTSFVSQRDVRALPNDDLEFPEGRVLTAVHTRRERSASAVRRKKDAVLAATGSLVCEACGFDFEVVYGELGHGYAECHHTVPLAELGRVQQTRLKDLAIVCSNCHRMIHRSRSMLTVQQLSTVVHSEVVDLQE